MIVIVGLGPMGAGLGQRLSETGHRVAGIDPDTCRREDWAVATGQQAYRAVGDLPWREVTVVVIAVRLYPQVEEVLARLRSHAGGMPLSVFLVTTLSVAEARRLGDAAGASGAAGDVDGAGAAIPEAWRLFEAPVSGGPSAAREGTLTVLVSGPDPTPEENLFLAEIAGQVFALDRYGEPALLKLLNNTVAAYNASTLASMLLLAEEQGVPARRLLETVRVASGRSWVADHFPDFADDLIWKDVLLLERTTQDLPNCDLHAGDGFLDRIVRARGLLDELPTGHP